MPAIGGSGSIRLGILPTNYDPTEPEDSPPSSVKPVFYTDEHCKPYQSQPDSVNCVHEDFHLEDEDDYWNKEEVHHISNPNLRLIFVDVVVRDTKIRALVDCGATCSLVDPETSTLLQKLNLPVRRTRPSTVITATGEEYMLRDTIFVPLEWIGKMAELKTKVLATLSHSLVLGLDALNFFGVIIDLARENYFFIMDPTMTYSFHEIPAPVAKEHQLNSLIDQGIRELTPEQKSQLQKFIAEKVPLLPEKLPCTNVAEHKIELIPGSIPFKIPQYTVPQALQAQMNAEIDKKLADVVIEPAQSEWSSPIVMVRKSDGKYRKWNHTFSSTWTT